MDQEHNHTFANDTIFNQTCDVQTSALNSSYLLGTLYTCYSIIFVISVLGNGVVCYIVLSSPRMRTVTNYFIMNLAVGDILITILCIPFTAVSYIQQHWPFNSALCPVVNYSQGVSVFVSAYTLVAISVDRYIAIMWPLKPRLSKRNSSVIIFMVWLVSTITVLPIAITSRLVQPGVWHEECGLYICKEDWDVFGQEYGAMYSKTLTILQFVIPVSVLLFTYTSIAIMIWCHRIPGEAENCRDQRIARSKRKMIKMMIIVVIVYTICWLPLNTLWIIQDHYEEIDPNILPYLFFASHWFAMSHTCYNPIIYCYMNSRFRSGFLQAIGSVPCIRKCCASLFILHPSTSFPLTSIAGTDSTILHRNNTYTTYISMRRKNGSRLSTCNSLAPVRSASMMRNTGANNHHSQSVVRRYRYNGGDAENEI